MKVYLAGPYKPEVIDFLREFDSELNEIGIKTTSTWYRRDGASVLRPGGIEKGSIPYDQILSLHGQIDLYEVSESDTIVVSMCKPGEYHTGGRHAETGYSLVASIKAGRPKRVIIVGEPKENIFHHIPGVMHLPDWKSVFLMLKFFNEKKNRGPNIIGLSGKKGAGKSTVSYLLEDAFGHESRHFATALRAELCEYVNTKNSEILEVVSRHPDKAKANYLKEIVTTYEGQLDSEMMSTPGIKEEFRLLQQYWGTEHRRNLDPFYWINRLDWSGKLTVGDVRFGGLRMGSEVRAVRDRGGIVVYVFDEEKELQKDSHASEQLSFTECDFTLLWKKNDPEWCVENLTRLCNTSLHFNVTKEIIENWYNTLIELGSKN